MALAPPDLRDLRAGVRRPWYERLFRLFFNPRMQPVPAPGDGEPTRIAEIYTVRDLPALRSPLAGDTFDFLVRLRCAWRLRFPQNEPVIISRERLERLIAQRQQRLEFELEEAIRSITREHTVAECAAVEQAINDQLANGKAFDEGAFILHCAVRARVGMDPQIRETFRHAWLIEAINVNEQHTTRMEIGRIGERAQLWQELLDQLEEHTTSDAVLLAVRPQDKETLLSHLTDNGLPSGLEAALQFARETLASLQSSGPEEAAYRLEQAVRVLLEVHGAAAAEETATDDEPTEQNKSESGESQ